MKKNRRVLLLGVAGALSCSAPAHAAMVFTDAAAFDAALARVHTESFESFALGDAVATLAFDGAITGAVSTDKVKTNLIVSGGVAPGGNAWSLKGGTTTIDLAGLPANAFGLYFEDRGAAMFTISLIGDTVVSATAGDAQSGFLGVIGDGPATTLQIDWIGAKGHGATFDTVRVGWSDQAGPIIPTPRSIALGLAGLAVVAAPRRRDAEHLSGQEPRRAR